ncbi:TRAP transporter TatT component family protein [candidate division KSB1 bacterium]
MIVNKYSYVLLFLMTALAVSGCSINKIAINATGSIIGYGMDALLEESDVAFAEQSAPANLKLLEGLIKADPENKHLLISASYGFSSFSLAFLEGKDNERAKNFYERGKRYGLRILLQNEDFKSAFSQKADVFKESLKSFNKDDVPALFWTGFSWGNWINLSLDNPDAIADLSRVETLMERVRELDETFYYGGVHLFFGTIYGSRSRMLGGDVERAGKHFDRAIEISGGKFLIAYVYKARFYARPMMEEELFKGLLQKVIDTPGDVLPEQRLVNEVAKIKAKELFKNMNDYF